MHVILPNVMEKDACTSKNSKNLLIFFLSKKYLKLSLKLAASTFVPKILVRVKVSKNVAWRETAMLPFLPWPLPERQAMVLWPPYWRVTHSVMVQ